MSYVRAEVYPAHVHDTDGTEASNILAERLRALAKRAEAGDFTGAVVVLMHKAQPGETHYVGHVTIEHAHYRLGVESIRLLDTKWFTTLPQR